MTMNGPISPATNARRAAAISACWTKSRVSRSAVTSKANRLSSRWVSLSLMGVPVGVSGVIEVLADDDVAVADLDHLDIGLV